MALKGNVKEYSDRTIWAEYRGGFACCLLYVPREHLRKLVRRATENEWDPKTHQRIERLNQRKWARIFAEEVFRGWRDCTPAIVRSMVEMDEDKYPTAPLEFSVDDCEELLYHAYDFDQWAQAICTDWAAFEAVEDARRKKNSAPTPAAS